MLLFQRKNYSNEFIVEDPKKFVYRGIDIWTNGPGTESNQTRWKLVITA